jgi:hypothetical protein
MPGSTASSRGIDYSNVESLELRLGTGADTVNVLSTRAGTTTNIKTGSGSANVVNVGSTAPAVSGNVDAIAGKLIVTGEATNDTLNVYDMNNNGAEIANITSSRLWGLGMAGSTQANGGITYLGVEALNVNLGSRQDTINVRSTNAGTTTTLRTGTGTAVNTVNVGSNSPGVGGTVDAIAGRLNVVGQSANDAVFVDDTGDGSINVGTLTSVELTGLDMAAGIGYSGLQTLSVRLGTGNDTVNVQSTSASAVTTVATGAGRKPL